MDFKTCKTQEGQKSNHLLEIPALWRQRQEDLWVLGQPGYIDYLKRKHPEQFTKTNWFCEHALKQKWAVDVGSLELQVTLVFRVLAAFPQLQSEFVWKQFAGIFQK